MPRPLRDNVQATTGGVGEAVRGHILAAAYHVISHAGLAGTTTRAVAEEAGIGAGTLYNYFDNRQQLVVQSIVHRAHVLVRPLARLPSRAGAGTVEDNLVKFAAEIIGILGEIVPLIAATFSDRELLGSLWNEFESDGLPGRAAEELLGYLLAEQQLGRVTPGADCAAAAAIVFGLCHDRAFQHHLRGEAGMPDLPGGEVAFIARALAPAGH